jgi:hypothetical protein
MKSVMAFVLFQMAVWFALPGMAMADDPPAAISNWKRFTGRFSWDFRALTYGLFQRAAESTQNPSNSFLHLSSRMADVDARPDLRFNSNRLELGAKPRMRLEYSVRGGGVGQNRWNDEWYLNEWLARLKVRENLFISYGRENLQWGPSFLFSPSNPFFVDNGRRNTYMEVPGMDFGRVVWIPSSSWSVSFIANSGEGANKTIQSDRSTLSIPLFNFEKTYALKADYSGREKYATVILSRKEDSETAIGFYGGWTVADAILLYGEGSMERGSRNLYPVESNSPLGFSMQALHSHDSAIRPVLLAGGSYTFASKGVLATEYAYYGPGYTAAEADKYYALRNHAAAAFVSGGALAGLAQQNLGMTALTGLRFQRRNYAMIQYSQPDIANWASLIFRYTQGFDDWSEQFTSILGCTLGKHSELFSVGTFMAGNRNREFTGILDRQWQLGMKYTY